MFKSLSNSVVARVDELRLARRTDLTLKVACSFDSEPNVARFQNFKKCSLHPTPLSLSPFIPSFFSFIFPSILVVVRKRRLVVKDLRMPLGEAYLHNGLHSWMESGAAAVDPVIIVFIIMISLL